MIHLVLTTIVSAVLLVAVIFLTVSPRARRWRPVDRVVLTVCLVLAGALFVSDAIKLFEAL